MSNTGVGPIYKRVIDAVIEASRNDFEEHGVSTAVLNSMQEKWQNRLTSSERAQFPWDPQPEPPQLIKSESNGGERSASHGSPFTNGYGTAGNGSGHNTPTVKQEPADGGAFLNLPPRPSQALGSQYASQRAMQLMQQQFGSQADQSITALQAAQEAQRQANEQAQAHAQAQAQSQPQPQGQPQAHIATGQPDVKPTSADLAVGSAGDGRGPSGVKQEPADHKPASLEAAQIDGAGDPAGEWEAVVARRNAHGDHEPMGRLAIDQTIREMVERNAQRLEGGGLMVPLDERLPSQRRGRKGKAARRPRGAAAAAASTPALGGDMAEDDDDDDEDEDAINSELDDPDETADTTQEGVYEGDVILCLYDKVQRVKNKWKCVLRDGILTIDGKDYIFHKASGEFEW